MSECEIYPTLTDDRDWFVKDYHRPDWNKRFDSTLQDWEIPGAVALLGEVCGPDTSIETRFHELADEWSKSTRHVSSVEDLTSHPSYRQIIRLGWDVVPLLLADLQQNRRFWFPALYAITNVRPFDPSDAGNGRRMTDAWIQWGKRKGFIQNA